MRSYRCVLFISWKSRTVRPRNADEIRSGPSKGRNFGDFEFDVIDKLLLQPKTRRRLSATLLLVKSNVPNWVFASCFRWVVEIHTIAERRQQKWRTILKSLTGRAETLRNSGSTHSVPEIAVDQVTSAKLVTGSLTLTFDITFPFLVTIWCEPC